MIDDLDALIAAQFEDMAAAAEVIFFLNEVITRQTYTFGSLMLTSLYQHYISVALALCNPKQ